MPAKVRVENKFDRVKKAAERAGFKNLGHAAAVVRKVSSRSIRQGKKAASPFGRGERWVPAPAGGPPFTHKGALKKGILYAMDGPERVIIGPSADLVGPSGMAHEFGGRFRAQVYQKRPFMRPALEKVQGQIPAQWRDTIREGG